MFKSHIPKLKLPVLYSSSEADDTPDRKNAIT